eukprot:snap_masked-scaffold_5-processed-gene-11.15-mRNA-1 protein AED:1.00 eAED:1.00 QI:0/-1/0/0/-1/1/1/0/2410
MLNYPVKSNRSLPMIPEATLQKLFLSPSTVKDEAFRNSIKQIFRYENCSVSNSQHVLQDLLTLMQQKSILTQRLTRQRLFEVILMTNNIASKVSDKKLLKEFLSVLDSFIFSAAKTEKVSQLISIIIFVVSSWVPVWVQEGHITENLVQSISKLILSAFSMDDETVFCATLHLIEFISKFPHFQKHFSSMKVVNIKKILKIRHNKLPKVLACVFQSSGKKAKMLAEMTRNSVSKGKTLLDLLVAVCGLNSPYSVFSFNALKNMESYLVGDQVAVCQTLYADFCCALSEKLLVSYLDFLLVRESSTFDTVGQIRIEPTDYTGKLSFFDSLSLDGDFELYSFGKTVFETFSQPLLEAILRKSDQKVKNDFKLIFTLGLIKKRLIRDKLRLFLRDAESDLSIVGDGVLAAVREIDILLLHRRSRTYFMHEGKLLLQSILKHHEPCDEVTVFSGFTFSVLSNYFKVQFLSSATVQKIHQILVQTPPTMLGEVLRKYSFVASSLQFQMCYIKSLGPLVKSLDQPVFIESFCDFVFSIESQKTLLGVQETKPDFSLFLSQKFEKSAHSPTSWSSAELQLIRTFYLICYGGMTNIDLRIAFGNVSQFFYYGRVLSLSSSPNVDFEVFKCWTETVLVTLGLNQPSVTTLVHDLGREYQPSLGKLLPHFREDRDHVVLPFAEYTEVYDVVEALSKVRFKFPVEVLQTYLDFYTLENNGQEVDFTGFYLFHIMCTCYLISCTREIREDGTAFGGSKQHRYLVPLILDFYKLNSKNVTESLDTSFHFSISLLKLYCANSFPALKPRIKSCLLSLVDSGEERKPNRGVLYGLLSKYGLFQENPEVRSMTLELLLETSALADTGMLLKPALNFSKASEDEICAALASSALKSMGEGFSLGQETALVDCLRNGTVAFRRQAGRALIAAIDATTREDRVAAYFSLLRDALSREVEARTNLGGLNEVLLTEKVRTKHEEKIAAVVNEVRGYLAIQIGYFSQTDFLTDEKVAKEIFNLIIEQGITHKDEDTRSEFLELGLSVIDLHGPALAKSFLKILEPFLSLEKKKEPVKKKSKKAKSKTAEKIEKLTTKKKSKKKKTGKDIMSDKDMQSQGSIMFVAALVGHTLDHEDSASLVDKVLLLVLQSLELNNTKIQKASIRCFRTLIDSISSGQSSKSKNKPIVSKYEQRCIVQMKALKSNKLSSYQGLSQALAYLTYSSVLNGGKLEALVSEIEDSLEDTETVVMGLSIIVQCHKTLGLIFEPYLIEIFEHVLECFNSSEKTIITATRNSLKKLMKQISIVGFQQMFPIVLRKVNSKTNWRAKEASILFLGSMSHLAKGILFKYLPQIIPVIVDSFQDANNKISAAGEKALLEVCSVIDNKELKNKSNVILRCLNNPEEELEKGLLIFVDMLYFENVDPTSAAVLMPIIIKGLAQGTSKAKVDASYLVDIISQRVTEKQTLIVYLPQLLTHLQKTLFAAIPTVRQSSALAIKSLVKAVNSLTEISIAFDDFDAFAEATIETEKNISRVLFFLFKNLIGTSAVERAGAANGLVELLGLLDNVEYVEQFIVANVMSFEQNRTAEVREGVAAVFYFLPRCFPEEKNEQLLQLELDFAGRMLTDDAEIVRNTTLRGAKNVVRTHALSSSEYVVDQLIQWLQAEKWRLRLSSLMLVNDFLVAIDSNESDGDETTEEHEENLEKSEFAEIEGKKSSSINSDVLNLVMELLPVEKGSSLISLLFILRADNNATVKQAANRLWKRYVSKSAPIVRKVFDTMIEYIFSGLVSPNVEEKAACASTLGEIVAKFGDWLLPKIVNLCREKIGSVDVEDRKKSILCVVEVIRATNEELISVYFQTILHIISVALTEEEDEVICKYGVLCFDLVYDVNPDLVKKELINSIVSKISENPTLVEALAKIISRRPKQVFPFLLNMVLKPDMNATDLDILGNICAANQDYLHYYFDRLFAHLFRIYKNLPSSMSDNSLDHTLEKLAKGATELGLPYYVSALDRYLENNKSLERSYGLKCLSHLFGSCLYDLKPIGIIAWKHISRSLYGVEDLEVVAEIIKNLCSREDTSESLVQNLDLVRASLKTAASKLKYSKDLKVLGKTTLPIFDEHAEKTFFPLCELFKNVLITNCSQYEKEISATAVTDIVLLISPDVLTSKFYLKLGGPLIRVSSDTSEFSTKIAIYSALSSLIETGGLKIKILAPQLQVTFMKHISTKNDNLRGICAEGLKKLIPLVLRVDNIVKELSNALNSTEESPIEFTLLNLMKEVLLLKPEKVSMKSISLIFGNLRTSIKNPEIYIRKISADVLGACLKYFTDQNVERIMVQELIGALFLEELGEGAELNEIKVDGFLFALTVTVRNHLKLLLPKIDGIYLCLQNSIQSGEFSEATLKNLSSFCRELRGAIENSSNEVSAEESKTVAKILTLQ